jgi:hypothetical protein
MEEKPRDYRKYPPKTEHFGGADVEFKKLNDHLSGNSVYWSQQQGTFQELYPSIYSIKLKGYSYIKLYDFFPEYYYERLRLITHRQMHLYIDLCHLSNRGYYLSQTGSRKKGDSKDGDRRQVGGLSAYTGIRRPELAADLDHLEDCLLIHRVRRVDLRGMPSEIVVHTPFTPPELETGKYKLITGRVASQATKTRRAKAMVDVVSESGEKFRYLHRQTALKDGFWFDYRFIKKSFGDHAQRFADFALTWFKKNLWALQQQKANFEKDFRDALSLEMNLMGIQSDQRRQMCYIAANKFRTIYCPLEAEICA